MNNKVYIVLHTLSIGGAERHASSIANFLAEHGYDVAIVLLDNNKVSYKLSENIKVVSLCELEYPSKKQGNFGLLTLAKLKLYKAFFNERYQLYDKYLYLQKKYINRIECFLNSVSDIKESVVISFMPIPNLVCSEIKQRIQYKLILVEFNSPQLEFSEDASENQLKRRYFPNADGFVFQTDEQKDFYDFLPSVKKIVIPNPIEEIGIEPFEGKRKKEIVNFCRLVKAKNLPLLINAFSMLVKDYSDYSLVIYGDGPERDRIKKQTEDLCISSQVFLKPFDMNVLSLVKDSAMFVSSSDREGISNSMLEAMAIGLPTICTDCPAGGARMFITNYQNGILVPTKDPNALYQAMKYMIDHPEEASEMAKKAVSIKETLNKKKILEKWESFIELIRKEES